MNMNFDRRNFSSENFEDIMRDPGLFRVGNHSVVSCCPYFVDKHKSRIRCCGWLPSISCFDNFDNGSDKIKFDNMILHCFHTSEEMQSYFLTNCRHRTGYTDCPIYQMLSFEESSRE